MTRSVIDIRDTAPNKFVPNPDSKQPAIFASESLVRAYLRQISGQMVPLLFTPKAISDARALAKKNPEDVVPLKSKWRRILDILIE
jgi:hypothetical protein